MSRRPTCELVEFDERDLAVESDGIARAAAILANGGVMVLRILPRVEAKDIAFSRASNALTRITNALVNRHRLPEEAYVEVDEESYGTPVAPANEERFLLPHNDGGHCSFLTPSRFHCPELSPADRVFSESVYWKRPSHKLYQGFLITNTGTPAGTTYYFNTLTLLWDAFIHRHHRSPGSLSEFGAFNLENVRRSRANRTIHGSRYLSFGALLGSSDFAHHVMPSGPRAESELWPVQYISLPALCEMADQCLCGICNGAGARLFCHACVETLGRTWPEVRNEYEVAVIGERHDLLIGNNLTQLHAANSHTTRTIRPICIVLDRPEGDAYEQWLADQWQYWHASSDSVPLEAQVT